MKQKHIYHKIISTGFGSGYCPIAPGTAGAALATLIWWVLSLYLSSQTLFVTTLLLTLVFTVLGVWSSGVMEEEWGKDPSRVVVDEMVGVWIPLLIVGNENTHIPYICYGLAAFVLFRLFDIFKPLGIRKMEALKGGWGIMFDDILAGIYSLLVLRGLQWLIEYLAG
jgi:phosphatidylglycerophosphatase A